MQPLTRSTSQVAARLHGLTIHIVCAEPAIAATLSSRFANFAAPAGSEADITVTCSAELAAHERPADGRLVYESGFGSAVYSPAEDALYAFYADGATMRCDAAAGSAEIAMGGRAESREWVVTRPLLTLALSELLRRRGLFPLHAACLAHGDAGVLVCGPSGAGKSTLTLALLDAGLDFLGDDLVLLEREGATVRAHGFPDELGLAADAVDRFPHLLGEVDTSPQPGWPKARADVRTIAPATRIVSSCEPRLVVLLSGEGEPGVVAEVSEHEALLDLLPSIVLTEPATCAAHLQALAALTESATLLRTGRRPELATVVGRVAAHLRT